MFLINSGINKTFRNNNLKFEDRNKIIFFIVTAVIFVLLLSFKWVLFFLRRRFFVIICKLLQI